MAIVSGEQSAREVPCPRCGSGREIDNYEQICVLTGINDAGDMFFEMTGRGADQIAGLIVKQRASSQLKHAA